MADLRLLYVSPVDVSRPTGPAVNEREFVHALGRVHPGASTMVLPEPSVPEAAEVAGAEVIHYHRARGRNPLSLIRHQVAQVRSALSALRGGGHDLVVVRLGMAPLSTLALAAISDRPVAVKTLGDASVGSIRREGLAARMAEAVVGPVEDAAVRRLMRRAVAVDACTTQLAARAVRMGADSARVRVIGNATNVESFAPRDRAAARRALGLDRFSHVVGYVGGRPWERGGAEMVAILPALLEVHPDLGVVIVGGGEGMDALAAQARALGVQDHAVMPGQVPYEAVPGYVNTFDVGVALDQPYRLLRTGNSYQKVRQYIASGVPVVTNSDDDGMIADNDLGAVVDIESEPSMVAAITGLLDRDDDARAAYATRSAAYAREHLSIERAVEDRLQFWTDMLHVS